MKDLFDDMTIDYYEQNAQSFFDNTANVEFSSNQDKFLSYLKPGSLILDFGCGSGRDSKYFLDKGFKVEAFDGSKQMCEMATQLTGLDVKRMLFNELDENEKYDGIWACASILHLPFDQLYTVFTKVAKALKQDGVFYVSFKYGDFQGERNGRYFTDLTETSLDKLLSDADVLDLVEYWISGDVRPGRSDEKWLNAIMKKV